MQHTDRTRFSLAFAATFLLATLFTAGAAQAQVTPSPAPALPVLSVIVPAPTPTFSDVAVAWDLAKPCPAPCVPPNQPPYLPIPGDHHGPGAAVADFNNDTYPDLYLVEADPLGNGLRNRLYLNQPAPAGGRRFEWVAFQNLGLGPAVHFLAAGDQGRAVGAIATDYDNDADIDIYVVNYDMPNVLFENQFVPSGAVWFIDVTAQTDPTPGVADQQFGVGVAMYRDAAAATDVLVDNSLSAAFADVDKDGDLDLYVASHNGWAGAPMDAPFPVPGRRDVLYLSNVAQGQKTFTADYHATNLPPSYTSVTGYEDAAGNGVLAGQRYSSSNGVIFADFDADGWNDLLVTNKVGPSPDADMLYMNQQIDGPTGLWAGYNTVTWTLPVQNLAFGLQSPAAMGVDVGDLDNDGDMDIYSTDISALAGPGTNDLWINNSAPANPLSFTHSAALPAVFSWGARIFDIDNDGWNDIHVATHGGAFDHLYWQTSQGTYSEIAGIAGVRQQKDSRGNVSLDFDRDGWLDLLVVNVLSEPVLYRNTSSANFSQNNYLRLRLYGDPNAPGPRKSALDPLGARVAVAADLNGNTTIDPGETQTQEMRAGSGNAASNNEATLHFGLGQASQASTVTITWPSSTAPTVLNNLTANQCLVVHETLGVLPGIPC